MGHWLWQEVSNLKHKVFRPQDDFRYASEDGSASLLEKFAATKERISTFLADHNAKVVAASSSTMTKKDTPKKDTPKKGAPEQTTTTRQRLKRVAAEISKDDGATTTVRFSEPVRELVGLDEETYKWGKINGKQLYDFDLKELAKFDKYKQPLLNMKDAKFDEIFNCYEFRYSATPGLRT